MAAAEQIQALFNAIQMLTTQVQVMADASGERMSGGGKKWDNLDRFKNLTVFDGNSKTFEEWSVKFRSLVRAADIKVGRLMESIESECTEEQLVLNKFDELTPDYGMDDEPFIAQSSAEMYNVLLNVTTGEANAVVRKSLGMGWLAWKRLTSSLNPRTLASGIKAISGVLNPVKITNAAKADAMLDDWDDKLTKLKTEYSQDLTNKMKVAVLYSMLPKDLQEKVLDACSVAWDGTSEGDAGELYAKVKSQVKNVAKARREMHSPKPMEVDRVSGSWADWSSDEWCDDFLGYGGKQEQETEGYSHEPQESEAHVQYIGKGGKKGGGKGFQGHCYICGDFGHSQWDCKGKGKSKGIVDGKGYGKDGNYAKGYGKDGNYAKGYGKGFGGYQYSGKGKGGDGKGGMQRACFGCGATDHLLRDCPKNPAKINQVEEREPEILFIGHVEEEWKTVPMKVKTDMDFKHKVAGMGVAKPYKHLEDNNRFKVLEVGEPEDMYVFQVMDESTEDEGMSVKWNEVGFVCAVGNEDEMMDLGIGDIVVDSAADESCWPVGQGDAYPTRKSSRTLRLTTANGADMTHYGEKEILFKYKGGENKEAVGIKFQVTDVKKPLLAVRRLVEKGCTVTLANGEGESFIVNKETRVKIPVAKKGGSFVIEARFVKKAVAEGFARQA